MSGATRTTLLLAVLSLFAAIPFLNGIGNEFLTWDDNIIILGQPFLRELSLDNLYRIFSPVPAREEWLPLRDLTLALNFSLVGDNPAGFLIGNIVLHAGATVAVFFLFRRLHGNVPAAFAGALVFGCHAIHVESVTWLSARKDPLSTLFLVLGLVAYIRYRDRELSLLPAAACFVLALLSKANAFVFPAWLIAYDLFYRRPLGWRERIAPIAPFVLLAVLHVVLYLRQTSLDGVIEPYPDGGLATVLLTDVALLRNYLVDLLLPLRHQAIYEVEFVRSPTDPAFLTSLGLLAVQAYVAWRLRRRPWIPFAITLAYLNLVPYLNLIPHGIYYAERYLYLPSVSFALLVGTALAALLLRLSTLRVAREAVLCLVAIYLGGHIAMSWSRNLVWADSRTFWLYQARVLPENPAPFMNLGETYEILGDDEKAKATYRKVARRRERVLPEAIYRLARIARRQGELETAARRYAEYLSLVPDDPRALNNLAEVLVARGDERSAEALYRRLASERPHYLRARANLARLLEATGRPEEARRHWTYIVENARLLPQQSLVEEARARLRAPPGPDPASGR